MVFLVGFVFVPLLFAVIDIPVSGSLKSPLLMMRSAPCYILFMPTFVAFFSAYSTNRLADVSWGQRAVEDGVDPGQKRIEAQAACIALFVPLMNVGFALGMAYLHLVWPLIVSIVAGIVMAIAGYTFLISLVSYLCNYACMVGRLFCHQGCRGDRTDRTGLGQGDVPIFRESSLRKSVNTFRRSLRDSVSRFGSGVPVWDPRKTATKDSGTTTERAPLLGSPEARRSFSPRSSSGGVGGRKALLATSVLAILQCSSASAGSSAVVQTINQRFTTGHPSNDLASAGVLMHQFDDLGDPMQNWLPCPKECWGKQCWCAKFSDRFSCSVINALSPPTSPDGHIGIFANSVGVYSGGFVLTPSEMRPLCS